MSERKVLNKYYPPDFDPSKIPRCKVKKDGKFCIRLMAPFNMRCNTCGEYIYKGKKFNSRKENVDDETYLGLYVFRFYIKCPRCIAEIVFKTDPENTDYTLEAGATRNFEAAKTAERLAIAELKEKEDEEKNNPMKVLENRTKASLQEMDMIETLEELREMRTKHSSVDMATILRMNEEAGKRRAQREEEEDEQFVRSIFGADGESRVVKRLDSDDDEEDEDEDEAGPSTKKYKQDEKPSDILLTTSSSSVSSSSASSSSATLVSNKQTTMPANKKSLFAGIIVKPKTATTCASAVRSTAVVSTLAGVDSPAAAISDVATVHFIAPVTAAVDQAAGCTSDKRTIGQSSSLAGLAAYASSSGSDSD